MKFLRKTYPGVLFVAALCIIFDHVWALVVWFGSLSVNVRLGVLIVLLLSIVIPVDHMLNRNREKDSSS